MSAPVPLTVVGGYLGAGKTTLINGMLRGANGRRLAILVNEFGALPIDEDLIIARSENLISIAGGCICCTFGDSLADALAGFARMDAPPDHVLVEASGVAIPSSIAATASLVSGMELHGTVVLADAQTIRARARDRFMGDTVRRQLADADIVVLTRSELVGGGRDRSRHGLGCIRDRSREHHHLDAAARSGRHPSRSWPDLRHGRGCRP